MALAMRSIGCSGAYDAVIGRAFACLMRYVLFAWLRLTLKRLGSFSLVS